MKAQKIAAQKIVDDEAARIAAAKVLMQQQREVAVCARKMKAVNAVIKRTERGFDSPRDIIVKCVNNGDKAACSCLEPGGGDGPICDAYKKFRKNADKKHMEAVKNPLYGFWSQIIRSSGGIAVDGACEEIAKNGSGVLQMIDRGEIEQGVIVGDNCDEFQALSHRLSLLRTLHLFSSTSICQKRYQDLSNSR